MKIEADLQTLFNKSEEQFRQMSKNCWTDMCSHDRFMDGLPALLDEDVVCRYYLNYDYTLRTIYSFRIDWYCNRTSKILYHIELRRLGLQLVKYNSLTDSLESIFDLGMDQTMYMYPGYDLSEPEYFQMMLEHDLGDMEQSTFNELMKLYEKIRSAICKVEKL